MSLNHEQAKSLSSFFFDVAKGLVLGGIGFTPAVPGNMIVTVVLSSATAAYICIRIGLNLLETAE